MKKKMFTAAVCAAMSFALCACNQTNPAGTGTSTGTPAVTLQPTATSGPTATPTVVEEMYNALPITNYDDYVASTVLPEGYVGLKVDKITDADVDAYVQEVLENNRVRELKDGPIEESDIAIIDYVGYLDGVAFEGGTAYSQEIEVGNSGYIEGFDDGLIGVKKGEKVSLNLTFPLDYRAVELAGKNVVFEVTVRSVAAQVLPEFTDEFVTTLTSGAYTTTADFCSYAKGFLTEERKYKAVMDYLVENAVFEKLNEEYISATFELQKELYALQNGFESAQVLEEWFGDENSVVLWTMMEKSVRRYEQDRIVLYCVAKAENLTLAEDEYAAAIEEYAASNGLTVDELYAVQDETELRQSMLMEKAMEYLLNNVVEVEKGEE